MRDRDMDEAEAYPDHFTLAASILANVGLSDASLYEHRIGAAQAHAILALCDAIRDLSDGQSRDAAHGRIS
jgi:hypothetical protein